MTISNDQITAWKEAAKAASPGPWQAVQMASVSDDWLLHTAHPEIPDVIELCNLSAEDAHFIAIAREAVPALIAEVERLGSLAPLVATEGHDAGVVGDEPIGAGEIIGGGRFLYRTTLTGERHIVDAATGFVWFKLPYDYRFTSNATQRHTAEAIIAALAPPLDDRTAGDEAKRSGPEQKPAETGG